ncbi:MAG: glutamate--tRNA ligase [Thermodesulfobacteriota bacterium]|nr:glutamate--tRNA ligase [Thermodesulfobacteriota bacterium]
MSAIVTRFPPSPTGWLHIGGARTALFNWLLARNAGGKFTLRIEDTDRARSTPEMTKAIVDSMAWLGLDWDEGPYFQSERGDLHNQYVDRLLESGHAYFCECTPEEVEAMREQARSKGLKPKYNGKCRERNLGPGPNRVVRFKTPETGSTAFQDMVKGEISIENAQMDDLVLRRPDGSVTYNMAVVVDDVEMGVTHILRGDDHVNNTPRQILLYKALGAPTPAFGHVPMILGPDKKKLSKRHGALSVMEYEKQGFLPQAVVNYLVRLGWGHGDREIFSQNELIELFSINGLSTSAACFDLEKLLWVNSQYIKEQTPETLTKPLARFLGEMGHGGLNEKYLQALIPLLQPRAKTLVEMAQAAEFFVVADEKLGYENKAVKKFLTPETIKHLAEVKDLLAGLKPFSQEEMERAIKDYLDQTGIKFKLLAQPLRVCITGKTASPGLFETMEVLGKDRVIKRMERALT